MFTFSFTINCTRVSCVLFSALCRSKAYSQLGRAYEGMTDLANEVNLRMQKASEQSRLVQIHQQQLRPLSDQPARLQVSVRVSE